MKTCAVLCNFVLWQCVLLLYCAIGEARGLEGERRGQLESNPLCVSLGTHSTIHIYQGLGAQIGTSIGLGPFSLNFVFFK